MEVYKELMRQELDSATEIYKKFIKQELDFAIQDLLEEDLTPTDKEVEEVADNFINNDYIWQFINEFLFDEVRRIKKARRIK